MINLISKACLVLQLKLTISHFKQHYTYVHTFFHPHVFQKTTKNYKQKLKIKGSSCQDDQFDF